MNMYWVAVIAGFIIAMIVFLVYAGKPGALAYTSPSTAPQWLDDKSAVQETFANETSSTIPQPGALKMYVNSFNMPTSAPQKEVLVTIALNGYVSTDMNAKMLDDLRKGLARALNLLVTDITASVKPGEPTKTANVAMVLTYSSVPAAKSALSSLSDTLVSTKLVQNLMAGGLPKLKGIAVTSMPAQASAVEKSMNTSYFCQQNRWCDSRNERFNFFLSSTNNIPTSIESNVGLPLKGISMYGPPSNKMSRYQDNYILGSFTCTWYMKINRMTFNKSTKPIVWFKMFAETPNRIQLHVFEEDTSSVKIQITIGNMNDKYEWTVPKTTLMSNGNPCLYALVYNKEESKATFYIGSMPYATKLKVDELVPIKLGLTQIVINDLSHGHVSLDANLMAFTYHKSVLSASELANLAVYFQNEAGGFSALKKKSDEEKARAAVLASELDQVKGEKDLLEQRLKTCPSATTTTGSRDAVPPPATPSKWQIKQGTGAANVSTLRFEGKKYSKINPYGQQTIPKVINPLGDKPVTKKLTYPSEEVASTRKSYSSTPVVNPTQPPPMNKYFTKKYTESAAAPRTQTAAAPSTASAAAPVAKQCGDGSVLSRMFLNC